MKSKESKDTIIVSIAKEINSFSQFLIDTISLGIYLQGTQFTTFVSFNNIFFKENVIFSYTRFDKGIDFSNTSFASTVDFGHTYFGGYTSFSDVNFLKTAYFFYTTFEDDVDFFNSKFQTKSRLMHCQFKQNALFVGTLFNQGVEFAYVYFHENTYFSDAMIFDVFRTSNSTFSGELGFSRTYMPNLIDLSSSKFFSPVDMMEISFVEKNFHNPNENFSKKDKRVINCYGIGQQAILIDYSKFTIDRSYKNKDQVAAQYEILLNGFRANGFTNSYQMADIEYKHFKSHEQGTLINRIFYWIQYIWWYLGYKKELILVWTVGFFILFTLVFWRYLGIFLKDVYSIKPIEAKYDKILHDRNDLKWKFHVQSLYLSIYYTTLIFFGLRMTTDHFTYNHVGLTLYVYLVFTLGLVCLGFMANWIITGSY